MLLKVTDFDTSNILSGVLSVTTKSAMLSASPPALTALTLYLPASPGSTVIYEYNWLILILSIDNRYVMTNDKPESKTNAWILPPEWLKSTSNGMPSLYHDTSGSGVPDTSTSNKTCPPTFTTCACRRRPNTGGKIDSVKPNDISPFIRQ